MWIVLSTRWDLGDVRAAFTIIISVLCTVGVWTLGYCYWRRQANQVADTASVRLFALFSIQGIGDAIDVLTTILWDRNLPSHIALIVQCIVVIVLTIAGASAGPFAKWSTRSGIIVQDRDVPGYLATADFDSGSDNFVMLNATMSRLKSAGFPEDQLIDFLPDVGVDWRYEKSQWNSSWSLDCKHTPRTEFEVEIRGNLSDDDWIRMPAFLDVLPDDVLDNMSAMRFWIQSSGFMSTPMWRDRLYFQIVESDYPDDNSTRWNEHPLRMVLTVYHLHNVPYIEYNGDGYVGNAIAESAAYTSIDCHMTVKTKPADPLYKAYPWMDFVGTLLSGILAYYNGEMMEKSLANQTIHHPGPDELILFMQAYYVNKDTLYKVPAVRTLKAGVQCIEMAMYTVIVVAVYMIILLMALAWIALEHYARRRRGPLLGQYESLRHYSRDSHVSLRPQVRYAQPDVPRTKLDWLLQTVRESHGRDYDGSFFRKDREDLEDEAKVSIYGDIDRGNGQHHVGVGRQTVSMPMSPYVVASPQKASPRVGISSNQNWAGHSRSSSLSGISMQVYSPLSYSQRGYFG